MIAVCFGDPCGIQLEGLMENAAALFNDLLPIFIIIVGFSFAIAMMQWITRSLREAFDPTHPTDTTFTIQKSKDKSISLEQITEKPKRGLVTLGDDGELADIPGEASLEDYRIIR